MLKQFVAAAVILFGAASVWASEDASMQQVYEAARAGKLTQAQDMMQQVLKDHPNSAKAHYVEAELLARMGQLSAAQAELDKAEQLKPGLPFVNPQTLQTLKAQLHTEQPSLSAYLPHGVSWLGVLLGGGVVLLLILVLSNRRSRQSSPYASGIHPTSLNGMRATTGQPMSSPVYPPAQAPAAGGGVGSSIMSGLATGAAVGAGMVAGEALMHHFMDGDRPSADNLDSGLLSNADAAEPNPAFGLGGDDFGIMDDASSSWDDGGDMSGDDDWS